MSIASVGGAAAIGHVAWSGTSAAARPPVGTAASDGVAMSPRAQFTSKVFALATSDPAQARKMITDLAAALQSRASEVSGPEATKLGKLIDMLGKAADSGDYSALASWGKSGGGQAARAYAVTRSSR